MLNKNRTKVEGLREFQSQQWQWQGLIDTHSGKSMTLTPIKILPAAFLSDTHQELPQRQNSQFFFVKLSVNQAEEHDR